MFCITYTKLRHKKKNPNPNFFLIIQISTLLKKNSTTAGKKSTAEDEPEDEEEEEEEEDSKVDESKEKDDGEAVTNPEATAKKSTKPADKTAEANETGTDASVKDESDADENNDDEKKSEVDVKPKASYKSPQKSYIKLVCIHCNVKCVTFKVNSTTKQNRKVQHPNKKKTLSIVPHNTRNINIICIVASINCR